MTPDPAVHPIYLPPEFRHVWILFEVIGIIFICVLGWQFSRYSAERPGLAAGYRRCLAGYAVFFLLPWLVGGLGIELGKVPSIFSFQRPSVDNPYILALDVTIGLMLAAAYVWICFYQGAEFFIAHPGTLGRWRPTSPGQLRAYALLMLVAWLVLMVLLSTNLLPVSPVF